MDPILTIDKLQYWINHILAVLTIMINHQ